MAAEGVERYEIERIVDKRYRNDNIEYFIKWRGYPDSQNTWEPSSNIQGEEESELLAEYEALAKRQQQQKTYNSGSRSTMNNFSPNKRRQDEMINNNLKKRPLSTNHIQSSNTPTGFERGYEAERVLGATDSAGELMLLVKWRNSDEADLVPARIVNVKCPGLVIEFYEQHSFWSRLPKINQTSGSTIR